jgi:DNA-binding response OmpR family regulator
MSFRRLRGLTMRILVIDDDRSVGAAIETLLNHQGCEVVLVEDGRLGVQIFEASNFDAVMVDIFMPDVDGLETIKALRQRAPTVPIIAMSGFRFRDSMGPTHDFLRMAASLGATYCLRKPFGSQQLLAAINAHLDHAPPKVRAAGG